MYQCMQESALKNMVRANNIRLGPSTRNLMQVRPRPYHPRYMRLPLSRSQSMCPITQGLPPRLHHKSTQQIIINLAKVLLLGNGDRLPRPLGHGKLDRNGVINNIQVKKTRPFGKRDFFFFCAGWGGELDVCYYLLFIISTNYIRIHFSLYISLIATNYILLRPPRL